MGYHFRGPDFLMRNGIQNVRFGVGLVVRRVVVDPCRWRAVRVQCSAKAAHHVGPVVIVLHVLFARKDELHRRAGNGHGRADGIVQIIKLTGKTAPESAAHRQQMIGDVLDRQVRRLRAVDARTEPVLRAGPDLELAVLVKRRRVHRLHGCVRKIWHLVCGFDHATAGQRGNTGPGLQVGLEVAAVERGRAAPSYARRCHMAIRAIVKDRL